MPVKELIHEFILNKLLNRLLAQIALDIEAFGYATAIGLGQTSTSNCQGTLIFAEGDFLVVDFYGISSLTDAGIFLYAPQYEGNGYQEDENPGQISGDAFT